jgi:tetratricopeptide (TPR) repeat protein
VPAGGNLPAELWRGRVRSGPVKLKILPAPAELSPEEQSQMSMEKAEFFAASGDWPSALASAQAVLAANPKVIRAHIIVGEAKEAQGDLAGARDSFAAAEGQFYEQFPNSYDAPQYLILKIATLEERLKNQPTLAKH